MRPTGLRLSSRRSPAWGSTTISTPSDESFERTMRGRTDRIAHIVQGVEYGHKIVAITAKILRPRHIERHIAQPREPLPALPLLTPHESPSQQSSTSGKPPP